MVKSLPSGLPGRGQLTTLVLLSACRGGTDDTAGEPNPEQDPTVVVSERIPTVAVVSWKTVEPLACHAAYGLDGATDVSTPSEAEALTRHEFVLRGLEEERSYTVALRCGEVESPPVQFVTGSLPSWLPELEREIVDPSRAAPGFLLTLLEHEDRRSVVSIVDQDGGYVWYADPGGFATRARLAPDRGSVVVATNVQEPGDLGLVRWVGWDGAILREEEVQGIHTDFDVLPDGTVATLSREVRHLGDDQRPFQGETIIELRPDGSQEVVWSVFDDFPPLVTGEYQPCSWDETIACYSHVNSLSYDPLTDAYLLTAFHLEAAFGIERASGELLWVLRSGGGDFTVPGNEGRILAFPHSVERQGDELLLLDNNSPFAGGCTAALIFSLDPGLGQATIPWVYASDECFSNNFLGNAQRLANDNVLVALPTAGRIDEAAPSGALVSRWWTQLGSQFRFAELVPSLY